MNAVKFSRTSHEHVVLTGAMWNQLCDTIERLDRFAVAPPLYLMRDDKAGRVVAVNLPPPGGQILRVKVKAVSVGGDIKHMTVVKWDGTSEIGAQFSMRAQQGHAVGDGASTLVCATQVNSTDLADVTWLEQLVFDPGTTRYQVLQRIDSTGRLGIDSARVEA
jgi:hypothetical protein